MIKPSVFISYKRNHQPTDDMLRRVEAALGADRFDLRRDTKIEPGDRWSEELYTWLLDCSAGIALVGAEPAKSEWCRREWWFLRERHRTDGTPVIPISVDGTTDTGGILDVFQILRPVSDDELPLSQLDGLKAARPSPESYLSAHHAWLRWQFKGAPLMGREPFSLADVYVETECGLLSWGKIKDDKEPRDPFIDDEVHGGRRDLVDTVMALVADSDMKDLIVVQGAPGSGKSAFTLRLANELLDRRLKPIHVRFNEFRLTTFSRADELIEDAIRIGPADEEPPRPKAPILSDDLLRRTQTIGEAEISEYVFILDGWDEVSITGNASYQAQLMTWLPRFREFFPQRPGKPVRLILTGRPSVEVDRSGVLRKETPVLTFRQINPTALRGFADDVSKRLTTAPVRTESESWSIDLDRLEPLFENFEQWFYKGADDRSEKANGMDVLGSPLLAFLTFRTLAEYDGNPADLTREPTALYHTLIDTTVKHAGKGANEGIEGSVHRGGELLRRLLHRVAGVITILGREAVSFTELDYRLRGDHSFKDWSTGDGLQATVGQATENSALHELVVNFYFKGGNTGVGCEFLHKSFREYLFAESVVAVLRDLSEGKAGPLDCPKVSYWEDFGERTPQFTATRQLSPLLAPQWLTAEVRGHLFWLIRRAVAAEPERWVWLRDLLLDVYIWWAEGVHLRPQPIYERDSRSWASAYVETLLKDSLPFDSKMAAEPARSTAADGHLGDALIQATALVHYLLRDQPRDPDPGDCLRARYRALDGQPRFKPDGAGFMANLFARVNAAGWRQPDAFGTLAYLRGADLRDADLRRANLCDADLGGAYLRDADLRRANLRGAYLRDADLGGADLSDANLGDADLGDADLSDANLGDADLGGAEQAQVNTARGNSETRLPQRITRPKHWANDDRPRPKGSRLRGQGRCI